MGVDVRSYVLTNRECTNSASRVVRHACAPELVAVIVS